ncbi:MAG: N-acetylmuramoyl-L-alanine amidase, partial [Firmicutes bacterium]|nr:N-acetylmuramoyl-L-alanine amidase [Bacillota bacterium]
APFAGFLGWATAAQGGSLLHPQMVLNSSIVLFARWRTKIFIDPGHGGSDPGALGNGMRESDINLDVSNRLAQILRAQGFEVMMSRTTDVTRSINERWQMANNWNADYFISVHTNSGGGTGVETIIPTQSPNNPARDLQATRRFAEIVSNTLGNSLGMRVRDFNGVITEEQTRHGSLGVLRFTRMIAVYPELAFIDSPLVNPDVNILRNRRQELAQALANGIRAFVG